MKKDQFRGRRKRRAEETPKLSKRLFSHLERFGVCLRHNTELDLSFSHLFRRCVNHIVWADFISHSLAVRQSCVALSYLI